MKLERKHFVAVGIGIVSMTAAYAYWQYKKLMNYVITLKALRINQVIENNADFDLVLNFQNKSDIKFEIVSQVYDVYFNNKLITNAQNYKAQTILPQTTSPISLNIKFNPEKAGLNLLNMILGLKPIYVIIKVKFKVKLGIFKVNLPYEYKVALKDLLKSKQN